VEPRGGTGPKRPPEDHQLLMWDTGGRESASPTLEHTSIRFEREDLATLRQMAEVHHVPVATLVRNIVHAFIAGEGGSESRPWPADDDVARRIAALVVEELLRSSATCRGPEGGVSAVALERSDTL